MTCFMTYLSQENVFLHTLNYYFLKSDPNIAMQLVMAAYIQFLNTFYLHSHKAKFISSFDLLHKYSS